MQNEINIVHYWGGFPIIATSKWLSALNLVKKCQAEGWNNWLVLSKEPDNLELVTPFLEAGCKVIYHPRSRRNFDFFSIYRNIKFLHKIKCDVFHCYNDHTSPIIAAMFARVPIRVWSKLSMSSYYEEGISPTGLKRLMPSTRITCWFANRILAISDAAKQEICSQVGFENKISIVDVPVHLELFNIPHQNSEIRDEFNILKSDYLITAVGHFIEVKGWDIAVPAFAKVCEVFPDVKLLFVGKKTSESYYQKICSQIKYFNLDDKVIFAGNRSDIPDILTASELFIFPSRSEGAGASLVEAMAAGVPCIATDAGGISEIIKDGENGLLFERGNSDELAKQIIRVISDIDLQTQLVETAKQGLQKFSIEVYVDSVLNHYKNLINK
ncbi:glycosyltransferase family 4 protein [Vibrio sp. 2-Bac 85]